MGILSKLKSVFQKESLPFTSAVIVAAGESSRMALEGESKQLLRIEGIPAIAYTLKAYESAAMIDEIILVTRGQDILPISEIVKEYGFDKVKKILVGGATRIESVQSGVSELNEKAQYVAVADGARPFTKPEKIDLAVRAAHTCGAAALGVPVKDTIKSVDSDGNIVKTVNREGLYQVQTPQVFELSKFRASLALCVSSGKALTDDCQVFELSGYPVKIVLGDYDNIKITYPEDLLIAAGIAGGLENE